MIPEYVFEAYEDVRQGGKYNMFDAQNVFVEMFKLGHIDAVIWLMKENNNDSDDTNVYVDKKKYVSIMEHLDLCDKLLNNLSN